MVGMPVPSENDVIIPDPCFDIRDVMDFKLLSPPSSSANAPLVCTLVVRPRRNESPLSAKPLIL